MDIAGIRSEQCKLVQRLRESFTHFSAKLNCFDFGKTSISVKIKQIFDKILQNFYFNHETSDLRPKCPEEVQEWPNFGESTLNFCDRKRAQNIEIGDFPFPMSFCANLGFVNKICLLLDKSSFEYRFTGEH